jgi:PREDICTED: similar to ENSANGP00000026912
MLEGKPPYCFHIYNKVSKGSVGDKVMMAIKGKKKKGIIVGMRLRQEPGVARYDSNNVVLIDDNGNPLGTRILVPIPNMLRDPKRGLSKLIAIATKFV